MPKLPEINRIRLKDIKLLKPELHDQLMEFCSELDPEKFPEATLITEGKYKTLAVLGTIHAKLARKSKKEKNAKKQLQEAENLILDAHALVGGGSNLSHRQKPERKTFGRAIMQGMSEGIQKAAQTIQMAKEMRELLESIKMYEKAGKLHSKKKEYADAGFFFQQAAELMAEVYKKTKNWKDLEKSQRLFQRARVNYEQAPELEQSADLLVRFAVCIVHTGYYHPDNEKKPAGLYHKAALLENDPKKKLDYALNAGRQYLKKGWGHTKKMLEVYQIAVRCEDKIEKKAEYLLECMTKIEASYRGFIIADLKKLKGTRENDEVIASLISAHVIELLSADPTLKYFKYEDVNRVSSLFDVIAELDTDKKIKDSFWISLVALHAAGGGVHSLNQFIDTVAELTKEDRKELVHTTIVKLIVEAKTQRDTGNFDVSSNLLSVAATLETDKKKKIELYLAAARDAFEEWKKEKDEQQVFKAINKSLNFYKKAIELISEPKEKTELARKTARMFAKEAEICQLNGQYGLAAILYYGAASMVEDKEMKKNYCLIEIQNWQALTDITKREKDRNPDDHYRNNNWRDSVKLFRSSMGSAYLIAAEAEENSNKKSRFFVLAAEYSKSKGSGDLAEIYKKAIDVLETESARNKLRDEVVQKLLKNASSPSGRAVTYVEIVKLYETKDEKIAALEKSAEHFIEANSLGSAIESYESILKLVEPEKSLPYHLKLGELCVKLGNSPLAHVSYKKASELSETKEQKFDYSLKAAEAVLGSYDIDPMYINLSTVHDAYNSVLENCEETKKAEVKKEASIKIVERADKLMENNRYISALNLFSLATGFETEELVNASLKEKEIVCELFLGRALLPTSEETLKTSSPKLYTLLTESGEKDFDKFFLTNIQTSMVLSQLTRVMGAFEAVKQEVGVNPARRQSAVELLTIGVRNWKKSGFKEAEGIPDYFLFQTLAVAKDSEQMTALKRLLETKTLRSSKDARKTVMWYLEDNKTNEKFMKLFFKVAEVSSENTVLKNIATLGIIHLINPEFEIGEIKSSEELKGKITVEITISEKLKAKLNKEVMQFMEKRTTNELVKQKFLERSEELYGNGMLPAVVTLYSKYSEYKNVLPLVDIAFAAMVMGDFDKVKFPTVNGVATMVYLSEEQRKLLLGATSQLDLLEPAKQKQWQGKTEMTMLPRDFMDKIASARADFKGKIEDMKFHFKSHMEGKKGEVEETFAFTSEYFANIEGRISTVQKGSKEFIKLQNIRKLLLSMQEIEKIDPTKAKESEGQIKKTLNDMALATKNLFTKFYGLDAEHLESLQAKLDIGLVRTMLLEPKEELTVKSLRAYDSADFNHLILAGKDPDNSGSCQRYDGTPGLMIGLSGYLLNSAVKIIRVENQDGIVVGRAMLKVIEADGKPVLFMERAYYRNNASDGNIDNAIIALAKKKAKAMGLELMTTWKMTDQQREVHLVRKGGFSPYEYTDALGGEHTRTEHDTTITVSILSGKSVVTGTTSMEYATAA